MRTAPGNVNMVAYGKINTRLSPCADYSRVMTILRNGQIAGRVQSHYNSIIMSPHSCMLLRHGPASDRNLFSRLHWPRGRSIPGSWMVGSLINDLFGTSTICHRVRQRCWMVGASSGRLDHIGRLDFSRGRG